MAMKTASREELQGQEREILRCVQFALRTSIPDQLRQERRREHRYPFPYPVQLVPVDDDDQPIDDPFAVLGKHLTHHGLDFYYQRSIPHRRVIARFDCGSLRDVALLMTLTWCRFGRHGWYENGGRFLSAVKCAAKAIS